MSASSEVVLVRLPGGGRAARPPGRNLRPRGGDVSTRQIAVEANGEAREREEHPRDPRARRDGGTELVISASGEDAAEALERLSSSSPASPERTSSSAAAAVGAASTPRASAAERSAESARTTPRTASSRAGATLSSSTPSPTKSGDELRLAGRLAADLDRDPRLVRGLDDRRISASDLRIGRGRGDEASGDRGRARACSRPGRSSRWRRSPPRARVSVARSHTRRASRSSRRAERLVLAEASPGARPHGPTCSGDSTSGSMIRRLRRRRRREESRAAARRAPRGARA